MNISNAKDNYIYEVIRVIDGKPLYLKEHHDRLVSSLQIKGIADISNISDFEAFAKATSSFIDSASIINDNIRIVLKVGESLELDFEHLIATYPTGEMYAHGVKTMLLSAMRDNPQAKVFNKSLRELSNQMIKDNNLFEVILVDKTGNITEGSRSNIFFIKDDTVYTSPASGVLLGVTRQTLLRVCQANEIKVVESDIPAASVSEFDAAFISGTSPKVLPIESIDEMHFDVNNSILRRLMVLYDEDINRDLSI